MSDPEPRHVNETVRYDFTRSELYEIGQLLAREVAHICDLERQKKDVVKSIGAALEHTRLVIMGLSEKINSGYEMRAMDCLIHLNTPRSGMKSVVRADSGEIVREEAMTPQEMQQAIPFEPEKPN